ncbi:MAG: hypothetical protein M1587_00195 [Thaumarchaeota archaeon]|nr:hypothetical protein [Nitrososphaerota archaeon]
MGENLNGSSPVNGILVELRINGTNVATGYTPVTFSNIQFGVQYGVVVYWFAPYYIRYINDSLTGIDLQRYDLVTLSQSSPSATLTGMFEYVPASQSATLNILAEYPNGTLIGSSAIVNGYDLHSSGMWLTVTPPFQSTPYTGTYTGGSILPFTFFNNQTYTVQMVSSSCGPDQNISGQIIGIVYNVFSHWQNDNSTNAFKSITLNGSATLTAIYDQVIPAPCSGSTNTATSSFTQMNPSTAGFAIVVAIVLAVPGFWRLEPKISKARSAVRFPANSKKASSRF